MPVQIETAAFLHGASIRAAPDPRSKRVSAFGHGDRHVGAPPILARHRMNVRAAAEFEPGNIDAEWSIGSSRGS